MEQIFLYRFLCGHNVFTILFYLGVGLLGQGVCLILCETAKLFQSSCTSLHSHHQFLYLRSFSLFNLDHSNGCVVVSPCVFLSLMNDIHMSFVDCSNILRLYFYVYYRCTFFVNQNIFCMACFFIPFMLIFG